MQFWSIQGIIKTWDQTYFDDAARYLHHFLIIQSYITNINPGWVISWTIRTVCISSHGSTFHNCRLHAFLPFLTLTQMVAWHLIPRIFCTLPLWIHNPILKTKTLRSHLGLTYSMLVTGHTVGLSQSRVISPRVKTRNGPGTNHPVYELTCYLKAGYPWPRPLT